MPAMPDNLGFLFAAFVVIWLLAFGYMAFLGNRISALRQDLDAINDDLDTRLQSAETSPGATPAERDELAGARRE
jgi:CcmD family protein